MLVDSHCHLDFPDFAGELDAIVGRARDAGVGRMVTISTRVKKQGDLLAIAERFPDVYCSVGTHPHNAHEELDVSTADLVARTRHPKVVAIGEAGLDYHYDYSPRDAQERGFRNHIAAARETGLPLVIHSREADDDMARILEEEMGKGAFPAVLHCYTGGPELARRAIALGLSISFTGIVTFKKSDDLRAIAASLPADRFLVETDAPYLAPGKFRGKRNEPAYVVETAKVLAETRGISFDELARQTTDNFFRLFSKVPRPAATSLRRQVPQSRRAACMTLRFTILGCGSSGGVPRPALGWGVCDPEQSEEPPPAHVVPGRTPTADGVTRMLVDTSPDLREQLLDANVDWVDAVLYTHEHADHTHGIDDLRGLFINRRKRVPVWLDERVSEIMHARFGYCFAAPPGSEYPPMVRENRMEAYRAITVEGQGGRSPPCPSSRTMATSPRLASASAPWPIPATSGACRRTA